MKSYSKSKMAKGGKMDAGKKTSTVKKIVKTVSREKLTPVETKKSEAVSMSTPKITPSFKNGIFASSKKGEKIGKKTGKSFAKMANKTSRMIKSGKINSEKGTEASIAANNVKANLQKKLDVMGGGRSFYKKSEKSARKLNRVSDEAMKKSHKGISKAEDQEYVKGKNISEGNTKVKKISKNKFFRLAYKYGDQPGNVQMGSTASPGQFVRSGKNPKKYVARSPVNYGSENLNRKDKGVVMKKGGKMKSKMAKGGKMKYC